MKCGASLRMAVALLLNASAIQRQMPQIADDALSVARGVPCQRHLNGKEVRIVFLHMRRRPSGKTPSPQTPNVARVHGRWAVDYMHQRHHKALDILVTIMHFSPRVLPLSPEEGLGEELENGTRTGPLAMLADGRADLCLDPWPLGSPSTGAVKFSQHVFATSEIVALVARGEPIPTLHAFFLALDWYTWFLLLGSFVISAVLWVSLKRTSHKHSVSRGIVEMLAVFLSVPGCDSKHYRGVALRLLLSACLLFSIVLLSVLQAAIMEARTNVRFVDDMQTLEDLNSKRIPLMVSPGRLGVTKRDLRALEVADSLVVRDIVSRVQIVSANRSTQSSRQYIHIVHEHLARLGRNRDHAWLMSSFAAEMWSYMTPPALLSLVHPLPEPLREVFHSLAYSPHWEHACRVDQVLSYLLECGFIRYWSRAGPGARMHFMARRMNLPTRVSGPVRLSLKGLKVAFEVWGLGLAVAFIAFTVEALLGYRSRFRRAIGKVRLALHWQ